VTTLEYLDRWRTAGQITGDQHEILSALAARRRVSLFLEFNALLYLGVLAIAAGLAWTISAYAEEWGDLAVLASTTAVLAACGYYCATRVPPYSHERVPAPGLAFDYVLYLACLTCAVELGYIEYRFQILEAQWDYYVLASAVLYFAVAYRFDNRLVLSLGIATLGAWFGVRLSQFSFFVASQLRFAAIGYGLIVAALGVSLYNARIKPHFLETYLHVAVNVLLAALLSGSAAGATRSLWTIALVATAGAVIVQGMRYRTFAFVVYGVLYAYIGIARELLRHATRPTAALFYIAITAGAVIVGLVIVSRKLGREE
jgi:hypothetical protein